MISFDLEDKYEGYVVGVDEVGYGAWAGPLVVVACAIKKRVIPATVLTKINDSKALAKSMREEIYNYICESDCCFWEVVEISAKEIDKSNILAVNLNAIAIALERLAKRINIVHVLVDGIHLPKNLKWNASAIKGGDKLSFFYCLSFDFC